MVKLSKNEARINTLQFFFLLLGPYYVKKGRNPKKGDLIGQAFCLQMEANLKEVGKRLNVCFTQRINYTNDQHNISNDLFWMLSAKLL